MTYLAGEILVHLIGAFLAGLALGWVIWGLGRSGGEGARGSGTKDSRPDRSS
ncbi:hypothetical protein H0I76_18125 [Limibaculum sp. M0105]|uniref:Uncharacterized protein n=1 Tax=Thermohalobaculum xanthum TaxID=2753746 RepID=A0A8J7M9D2_9RHOB|nr:hypothetical protein [Thermohalobaculum xanthum]MBK0401119.1 hypothetical protein [Thermohalobaculum xanthum]